MSKLVLIALALMLSACAARSPQLQPPPTPVWVDCRQPATPPVPSPPMESYLQWIERGPEWAVQVLDVLTLEREYRHSENACVERMRKRILNPETPK